MQKFVCAGALLGFAIAAAPATAQPPKNQIGPSLTFTNGNSAVGVEGRINLAENVLGVKNSLSLRPFIHFPAGRTDFGAAVTYDFDFNRYSQVTPYLGVGLGSISGVGTTSSGPFGPPPTSFRFQEVSFYGQGGVDIGIHPNWALSASFNLPFNSNLGSSFSLGANYRF
jgi:opacity protein-like surface antigen